MSHSVSYMVGMSHSVSYIGRYVTCNYVTGIGQLSSVINM